MSGDWRMALGDRIYAMRCLFGRLQTRRQALRQRSVGSDAVTVAPAGERRAPNRSARDSEEVGADDSTSATNSAAKRAVTARNEAIPGVTTHRT